MRKIVVLAMVGILIVSGSAGTGVQKVALNDMNSLLRKSMFLFLL